MDLREIISTLTRDQDYPERQFTIDVNRRVLEGAIYEHLPHGFHVEREPGTQEYVPLRSRRPAVKYNICRLVVEDSTSLLFSEGHFPTPNCDDPDLRAALIDLMKDAHFNEAMQEAAITGSVGSSAIHFMVLPARDNAYRVHLGVHTTDFLTPKFDPRQPDQLLLMTERYKVKGGDLRAAGYDIEDDKTNDDFWFHREWDRTREIWYLPYPVRRVVQADAQGRFRKQGKFATQEQAAQPIVDEQRTVTHNLGFVPWVWVRNLPGKLRYLEGGTGSVAAPLRQMKFSNVDGACTFSAAIDTMIEIDYQMSQTGRGLKYSMDPTLLVKEPAVNDGTFVKDANSALIVSEKGDAKLLEIGGGAFQVVLDYVRALREQGLESMHGNRVDASKLSAAQSGRAMELMNQALIWLADRLRVSYGEGALLSLLRMAILAHPKYPLMALDKKWPESIKPGVKLTLNWPRWYQPTSYDRAQDAQALGAHKASGTLSRKARVDAIAADFDIEDPEAELKRIEDEIKEEQQTPSESRKVITEKVGEPTGAGVNGGGA